MQPFPFQSSFRKTYTVLVRTRGDYIKGKWVEGEAIAQELIASIQPVGLKEMDRLVSMMQGRHIASVIKIYTEQQLDVAGEDERNGSIVLFENSRYEVIARSSYHSGVIEHYRYFAQKVS